MVVRDELLIGHNPANGIFYVLYNIAPGIIVHSGWLSCVYMVQRSDIWTELSIDDDGGGFQPFLRRRY